MSAVASSPPTPPSPPPGAEHSYDVLATRVIRQLSDADSLDTKLGAAVAILVALAGVVYAAQPPRIFAAIVSGWLAVALLQAMRGFAYDTKFADGVTAKFLTDRLALDSAAIKWHSLELTDGGALELVGHLLPPGIVGAGGVLLAEQDGASARQVEGGLEAIGAALDGIHNRLCPSSSERGEV